MLKNRWVVSSREAFYKCCTLVASM